MQIYPGPQTTGDNSLGIAILCLALSMSLLADDPGTSGLGSELAVYGQGLGLMANERNHRWPKSHLKLPIVLVFSFLKSMNELHPRDNLSIHV